MTPCLIVFIGVLCTVANVDARLSRRSEIHKVRRSSRNGIQYFIPRSRRFGNRSFRREAEDDIGSNLVSSIQKQVADQISFQQELQKRIQDRMQQKLSEKYKNLENKLAEDNPRGQWYNAENNWWPQGSGSDDIENSFLIFGPRSMSRTLSRSTFSRRSAADTASRKLRDYDSFSSGNQADKTLPMDGTPSSLTKLPPSQSEFTGGSMPPHATDSGSSNYPSLSPPDPLPSPSFPLPLPQVPSAGHMPIPPGLDPILNSYLTSIPDIQQLSSLAGVDTSSTDLNNLLKQLRGISELLNANTGESQDSPANTLGPYSVSINNGKSAWNVNFNPRDATRRQYDEFADAEQYDGSDDGNPYDVSNVYDQSDAMTQSSDLEDSTSFLDPSYSYQDADDSLLLNKETCDALQPQCAVCIQNAVGPRNEETDDDAQQATRENRVSRRFSSKRRGFIRRASRRQYEQPNQDDQGTQYWENIYGQDGSYDPYEETDTYEQYDPQNEMNPSTVPTALECDEMQRTCTQCIINALEEALSDSYEQQMDPELGQPADDDQIYDAPYETVQARMFNANKQSRRYNRASRMTRKRRYFT